MPNSKSLLQEKIIPALLLFISGHMTPRSTNSPVLLVDRGVMCPEMNSRSAGIIFSCNNDFELGIADTCACAAGNVNKLKTRSLVDQVTRKFNRAVDMKFIGWYEGSDADVSGIC